MKLLKIVITYLLYMRVSVLCACDMCNIFFVFCAFVITNVLML